MYSTHELAHSKREIAVLPFDLTREAARQFPEALTLAKSLEADRASLDPIHGYIMEKQGMSAEEATKAIDEYMKFLVLAGTTKEKFAPSEEADIAWHAHILHTALYEPFCRKHFGRFVHHVPSAPDTHPSKEFLQRQNMAGELFFGLGSIYRASHHGHCMNHHDCVSNPNHCVLITS